MRLAQIQMHVTADKTANLRHAEELLRSVRGADMAILPEMFCCPYDNSCFRAYGEPAGGAAYQMLSRTAQELGLWLVGGSLPELDDGRVYNTSLRRGAGWDCASASTCGSRSCAGSWRWRARGCCWRRRPST